MPDAIPSRLREQARVRPHALALFAKDAGGQYRGTSFASYWDLVERAGRAMIASGLSPGGRVCILGYNRPEWVVFAVAAMAAGGAPAGIYLTSSAPEIEYILDHAEPTLLLVETAEQFAKIAPLLSGLASPPKIVAMAGARIDDGRVTPWDTFLESGSATPSARLEERLDALAPDTVAVLIYTSGTTGPPKAVMLSHDNLVFVADVAARITSASPSDVSLSYLPLAHIAEQAFSIYGPASVGYPIYFAESLARVPDDLKAVRPTIFFGVPRIWEKFDAGIEAKLQAATPARRRIFEWAQSVGRRVSALSQRGESPTGLLEVERRIADKLVFSKLRAALGLDRVRMCVSGAAPIAQHVLERFAGLDLTIHEVYGQSEGSGPTTFNRPGRVKLGTVGPAIPGVDVRVADDGEILVRGRNVFLGYYKDPAATAETVRDGWLHSGDLGELDGDGFLRITGRKKEILITAGGKNISPRNIEEALKALPLVEEAVVIGDRRPYLTALVTLGAEALARRSPPLSVEAASRDARVRDEIARHVEKVNADLASVETVKRFHVLPRALSIDTGELTPSMKLKRKVIAERFADEIEAMYRGDAVSAAASTSRSS